MNYPTGEGFYLIFILLPKRDSLIIIILNDVRKLNLNSTKKDYSWTVNHDSILYQIMFHKYLSTLLNLKGYFLLAT